MTTTTAKTAAAKPVGMPFGNEDPKRQQRLLIAGIGGAALVVAVALLFIFRPWNRSNEPLRLNDDPAKIAQLTGTKDFAKLPFERREIYMKMMDSKKPQLVQAHANGQISDDEYQKALIAAHLGKQLDEMGKYYAKPAGPDRVVYLDKVLNKKEVKDEARKVNPTAKAEKKEEDLWRSDAGEQAEIATWPQDVQTRYNEFRNALAERKKLFKEDHPKAKKPTTATTGAALKSPTSSKPRNAPGAP